MLLGINLYLLFSTISGTNLLIPEVKTALLHTELSLEVMLNYNCLCVLCIFHIYSKFPPQFPDNREWSLRDGNVQITNSSLSILGISQFVQRPLYLRSDVLGGST